MKKNKELSSFRDPSGYIYYENNKVFRRVNKCYFKEYNHLMKSGLYEELINNNLMVKHKEIEKNKDYIVLEVDKIPYISYPYEWTFNQLRDAGILTLEINKIAMKYGMILKDASAYNVQFNKGKVIFIDTLSFMFYKDNSPWGAYGQFSRHFIAPLVLMKHIDIRMNKLLECYIDGIPLDLCSRLLGKRGGMISYLHIKMQNKSINKHNVDRDNKKEISIKKQSIINMFDMIERQLNSLKIKDFDSEWKNYYDNTNYNDVSKFDKHEIIKEFCNEIKLNKNDIIFDLGANDGRYSELVYNAFNNTTIAFDIDNNSVERNYLNNKKNELDILPLVMDINNPSSGIGFSNSERLSFMDRGNAGLTLVLAFIHHIVISNNISFEMLVNFLSMITKYLIIEFVPKEDSQVQLLLSTREDIFPLYDLDNFKKEFSEKFKILKEVKIKDSERTMFLMEVISEK